MAYEKYVKQTFVDYPDANATVLQKEHMDHIEDGIVNLEAHVDEVDEVVQQNKSDITNLKLQATPSITATRFEEADGSGLVTRTGVEITISEKKVEEDGSITELLSGAKVYDGEDGTGVDGCGIYPFDPGSADLSGNVNVADVTITYPYEGRYLQMGDLLLTESGELYRVTLVTADLSMFAVELYTTLGSSSDGILPEGGTDGQVLTIVSGSPAWADIPEVDAALAVRTVELVASNGSNYNVYTLDKTLVEIEAAYAAGVPVMLYHTYDDEDMIFPLIGKASGMYFFVLYGETQARVIVMPDSSSLYGSDCYAQVSATQSTAELPTGATEGQVLTADADGKPVWADASGGGAFVVNGTLGDDGTTVTIDKTYAEILEAYNNNKIPSMGLILPDGHMVLPLYVYATDGGVFVFQSLANDGMLFSATVIVSADSVEFSDDIVKSGDTLPTGGTAGQVLTIGSDGSPVWADPVATSAEGVEFG